MVVGSVEVLHNGGPLLPQARLWDTRKIRCTSNKWELEVRCSILDVAARVKDLSNDLPDLPKSLMRLRVVVLNITVKSSVGNFMRLEFNNCPRRCDLLSLLHFCRQLYMFRVLIPTIRSSYSCNYSFWYWLTAMNKDAAASTILNVRMCAIWVTPETDDRCSVPEFVVSWDLDSTNTGNEGGCTRIRGKGERTENFQTI